MSQTALYANVLARIGAERNKILSENKLRALTEEKSLSEFTAHLQDTSYRLQTSAIPPPLTSGKLERAFRENQIESYIKIVRNSPKKVMDFLRLLITRFEVDNVKALIKATYGKLSRDQKIGSVYFSVEDFLNKRSVFEEAALATDVRGAAAAFKETIYEAPLRPAMGNYERDGSTAYFDVFLDKEYYQQLHSAYQKLPKQEKTHALFYASIENDGFVLLTLMRGKNLNYDSDWLRLAVPNSRFLIRHEDVEAIITAEDFDSAFKIAQEGHYGKFFVKAQTNEESIANAEHAFRKELFEHVKKSRFSEIFNVGLPLTYMAQKNVEVNNLIVACLGVEAAMPPEDIAGKMLL